MVQQSNIELGAIISTGIDGEVVSRTGLSNKKQHDQFVDIPLPFYYLFYATDKPLTLSVRGKKVRCNKHEGVFIKKSVPFSVLLTWEGHGLERRDICAARFTTKNISDLNVYYNRNFEQLRNIEMSSAPVPDYVFFDFSTIEEEERAVFRWILMQIVMNNIKDCDPFQDNIQTACNDVQCHYILNSLTKYNPDIAAVFHSCSVTSISERVADMIMKDYSINWSIDDLAQVFSMSSSSLKKKMYDDVGSIADFIHKIKLTEGLRRLRRTKDPIYMISESLGYCTNSYFASSFKKYFNMHPSDVRKRGRNSD
jgi:AraC-like DNA-binding protein